MLNTAAVLVFLSPFVWSDDWPQFRGPNSSGIATSQTPPPIEFGPGKRVLWKQSLPPGHSSPVISGDRIFVTGFDKANGKLELLCLSRKDGRILWRQAVAAEQIEKVHAVSSPATATPAVDDERVYVYFGSYGLLAFDFDGKQQWAVPLPLPKTSYGSGTSPVVAGELVILNREMSTDGFLLAVDRKTGKTAWKQPYPPSFGRQVESYSTPVIWNGQAVLNRNGFVDAYDLKDGKRKWWVIAQNTGTSTVVVDQDTVYAATFTPVGEADMIVPQPDFATLLQKYDQDGDGQISEAEFPADLAVFSRPDTANVPGATMYVKRFFKNLDQNHDGKIQEKEWVAFCSQIKMASAPHGLLAIKPTHEGDVTKQIAWRENTAIPEVPTPLLHDGRLYLVRNGGVVTCLDVKSGKVLYRERIGAGGPYYSSPIAVNGRIYVASGDGTVVVLAAGDKLKVLARNDLAEEIFATPAVAEGILYVRTSEQLYAFGDVGP